MIKKITKKLYQEIVISRKRGYGIGMGRTVMKFFEAYYETTGSTLSEVSRFQSEERRQRAAQVSLF